MDDKSKKPMGILALLGGSKASSTAEDDEEMSSGDLALKAVWRAIKDDDFDGFRDSMTEWSNCSAESDSTDTEDDSL